MAYCDQCGRPVAADATVCPHCGAALEPLPPATSTPGLPMVPPAPRPPPPGERIFARFPQATAVPQGPGPRAWLGAVVLRNLRGTFVGMFAAWFNVPFIVLMGGIGALFGGIAGVVSGTIAGNGVLKRINDLLTWIFPLPVTAQQLLPTAAAQVGGIVGGILGAINGALKLAWMAFDYPWEALYAGDPLWPTAVALGQIVTSLVVALLYVWWTAAAEGPRLRVSGARRMSRREELWLMPLVLDAAARLGLTALPRILIDDRREPNAHAGIRHVVVNYGLLEQLNFDREAVKAVIGHELDHWRNGYAVGIAWSKGIALPLYLLYELADRLLRLSRSRPLHFIIRFLFWSVIVTVRYLVIPVQAAVWRREEFRADAAVAAAGMGEGLRRALTYMRRSFDGERSGWDRAVSATHPPTELRLEAVEEAGRDYPLVEDHPLARALPSWSPGRSSVERGW